MFSQFNLVRLGCKGNFDTFFIKCEEVDLDLLEHVKNVSYLIDAVSILLNFLLLMISFLWPICSLEFVRWNFDIFDILRLVKSQNLLLQWFDLIRWEAR